jgi:hypothetical protein
MNDEIQAAMLGEYLAEQVSEFDANVAVIGLAMAVAEILGTRFGEPTCDSRTFHSTPSTRADFERFDEPM